MEEEGGGMLCEESMVEELNAWSRRKRGMVQAAKTRRRERVEERLGAALKRQAGVEALRGGGTETACIQ
jgi:hypothetical protein